MGPKRWEVCMSAIWRYFIYSVLVGRCSRSLNSPLLLMIQGLFTSIFTIVLLKWPKKTRDVSAPTAPGKHLHRKEQLLRIPQWWKNNNFFSGTRTPETLISLRKYCQSKYISTNNSGSRHEKYISTNNAGSRHEKYISTNNSGSCHEKYILGCVTHQNVSLVVNIFCKSEDL